MPTRLATRPCVVPRVGSSTILRRISGCIFEPRTSARGREMMTSGVHDVSQYSTETDGHVTVIVLRLQLVDHLLLFTPLHTPQLQLSASRW